MDCCKSAKTFETAREKCEGQKMSFSSEICRLLTEKPIAIQKSFLSSLSNFSLRLISFQKKTLSVKFVKVYLERSR